MTKKKQDDAAPAADPVAEEVLEEESTDLSEDELEDEAADLGEDEPEEVEPAKAGKHELLKPVLFGGKPKDVGDKVELDAKRALYYQLNGFIA